MTIATISIILDRIETAKRSSQIAVFVTPGGRLDAMFASTFWTQDRIKSKDQTLVGVFDNTMPRDDVYIALKNASVDACPATTKRIKHELAYN